MEWFSYLKHLDVPGKLNISHSIIEKLIKSDLSLIEDDEDLKYDDIVDHGKLSESQLILEDVMKKISVKEAAFHIAQIEYENKEKRFIEKTNLSLHILDQSYAKHDLTLHDIDDTPILGAISERNWSAISTQVGVVMVIFSPDVGVFQERINLLMKLWVELSRELSEKIRINSR